MQQNTGEFMLSVLYRCIPVRVSKVNGKDQVDVLMITSRGGKGLVFPKVGQRQALAFTLQQLQQAVVCTVHPVDASCTWLNAR